MEKVDLLLPLLPWPTEYESDKFQCPAFTCVEVIAYANGTVPAGTNLPNYESVRQTHGSRNFCFSNVVQAHEGTLKTTFLSEEDTEFSKGCKGEVFFIQLAFHELLGHGSGKLFAQDKGGDYNFSWGKVIHPFTNEAVRTCYGPGETWNSVFGQMSAAFEECRAECVGIFLSAYPQALEVFGHRGQDAEDIMYINWLMMARAGLVALEFFSVDSGDWRQAHMQDNKERAMKGVDHGKNFLEILYRGKDDLILEMNRHKIRTVGLPAIGDLLLKLQVYRSTADVQSGKELFAELTSVPDNLLRHRRALLAKKTPRPMFSQANTRLIYGNGCTRIEMEQFEPTSDGLIRSYLAHFEDWMVAA